MTPPSSHETDVLIVGAGPTGLVLALWLTRLGVRVRIVDKTSEPGTTSRALAVQARTLELYRQVDLADAVVARGRQMGAVNLWSAGRQVAHAVLRDIGAGISPFPFALIFPQDEHERLLIDRLREAGVEVERQTAVVGFEDDRGPGRARRLESADGATRTCEASYIAGCDGAHSTVRQALGIGFPGGTYEHLFYVADVERAWPGDERRAARRPGYQRLSCGVSLEGGWPRAADRHRARRCRTAGRQPVVERRQHARHRVAAHRRRRACTGSRPTACTIGSPIGSATGRAFLLGDAAHIHSPVGGQGMNTGIGDAVNLAWKLAAVVHGRADAALLDSYEPERIAFARRLVATTDQAFTGVTSSGSIARRIRLNIVPAVVPRLLAFTRRAAPDVPDDLADGGELPWQRTERRPRRRRAWRRSVAVGDRGRHTATTSRR